MRAIGSRVTHVPDIPVEAAGSGRYPGDMETRVALLEQAARTIVTTLGRIELRLDVGLTQADNRGPD